MYKNKDLAPEVRAKDLLSKMTLDEKLMQMNMQWPINEFHKNLVENDGEPTLAPNGSTFACPESLETIDDLQDYYLNKTRLGIPLLTHYEALHGLIHPKTTKFPQCAGIGGSFNRENVKKMGEIIGRESKAFGVRLVYAPNVDIPRDPRWGRTMESYGEDPYATGELGSEYVKGIQSNDVAACAKHYVAFGATEGGLLIAPAHIGEREIREVMLEPFKKCIDAGLMALMPSHNEVDGIPVHASKKYLRQILRDEMGFDGVITSDFSSMEFFGKVHHVVPDHATIGKRCLAAGMDIESPFPFGYDDEFKQAILNGEVDMKLVDEAVLRVLTLKFKLGLFENPYTDKELVKIVHNKEAIDLSREIDEESILLLKNDGMLPLNEKKVGKVAVIGNNAKNSSLGNYINHTDYCVSFYDGMVDRLGEENVLYSLGCNALTCTDEMIADAVETAKKADTVFLAIGDCCIHAGGEVGGDPNVKHETTVGEGYDTHYLGLTPSQQRLFDAITALNKPTLLVFYGGRPYALEEDVKKVDAFMYCWGGGEQNGIAFANLIFGDKTPSARLSVSFPKSTGSIPCYYNHKQSARGYYKKRGTPEQPGRDYVWGSSDAWMSFGYGLSYTNVEYSDLKAEVLANGDVKASVTVENKGDYDINESVLLFVRATWCPISPFEKRLRKFDKVFLKKGDKKTVEFLLTDEDFSYIDEDYKTVKHTGEHKLLVENLECSVKFE